MTIPTEVAAIIRDLRDPEFHAKFIPRAIADRLESALTKAVAWIDKGGGIAVVGTHAEAWRSLPDGVYELYAHAHAPPAVPAESLGRDAPRRVFIDMDGVIVDFDAYKAANGLTGDEVKRTPGAYLAMPAIPGAIEAVRSIIGMGFEVWIATKPPTGVPYAYSDKAAWIMEHLPELKRRIIVTHDKGLLGDAGDFLCDDRPHKANCERFAGTLLRFVDSYHWPQALDFFRLVRDGKIPLPAEPVASVPDGWLAPNELTEEMIEAADDAHVAAYSGPSVPVSLEILHRAIYEAFRGASPGKVQSCGTCEGQGFTTDGELSGDIWQEKCSDCNGRGWHVDAALSITPPTNQEGAAP